MGGRLAGGLKITEKSQQSLDCPPDWGLRAAQQVEVEGFFGVENGLWQVDGSMRWPSALAEP